VSHGSITKPCKDTEPDRLPADELLGQRQLVRTHSAADASPTGFVAPVLLLSARELQVLRLIAQGSTNQHIAAELQITHRTAQFHVAAIIRKLSAVNRAHAVNIAWQLGYLDASGPSE